MILFHPFYVAVHKTNSYRTNEFKERKRPMTKASDILLTFVALVAVALMLGLML